MAQQTINVGGAPNDTTGDTLRASFQKCNANFTELYARPAAPITGVNGQPGPAITIAGADNLGVAASANTVTISSANFSSSAKGIVPASGGGTANFLRADGTWVAPAGGGASVTIGASPPGSPTPGSMWWDTNGGNLYIWYDDGNTQQWVIASNPTGAAQPYRTLLQTVDPAGGVYAVFGPLTNAYDNYEVEWMAGRASGSSAQPLCCHVSTDGGVTYQTSGYHYSFIYAVSSNSGGGAGGAPAYAQVSTPMDVGPLYGTGLVKLIRPWSNGFHPWLAQASTWGTSLLYSFYGSGAMMGSPLPITHMRFLTFTADPFTAGGYFKLYGIRTT